MQEKFSKQPQGNVQILTNNIMDKKFMDKVMEIIEQEMENGDFNVDMLATHMSISRTKLFSKLKAITGQTPADFIMTLRLKRAAFLLKNNMELNIAGNIRPGRFQCSQIFLANVLKRDTTSPHKLTGKETPAPPRMRKRPINLDSRRKTKII